MATKKQATTKKAGSMENAEPKPQRSLVEAKIDRLLDFPDNNIKAYASVNIAGTFAIHRIKVMDSNKGLFVSMPNYSYADGEGKKKYKEYCHPITAEARTELISKVMEAYEQALQEQQTKEETESEDESESESEGMTQQM